MADDDHSAPAIRAEAIESLLIEKGLISAADIDEVVERYNDRIGPLNGARVVARAWRDPRFKRALLEDGTAAIAQFAFEGGQTEKLVVVDVADRVLRAAADRARQLLLRRHQRRPGAAAPSATAAPAGRRRAPTAPAPCPSSWRARCGWSPRSRWWPRWTSRAPTSACWWRGRR